MSGRSTEPVETDPAGRYIRYNEELGRGAFKIVYRAIDREQGLEVAWNQIRLEQGTDFTQLWKEIIILQQLKHPNIIQFYHSWIDEAKLQVVFITEWMTSGTLKQFITRAQRVKLKVVKNWSVQILEGINYLHTRDPPIIHRDIKCDNIFINGALGLVKIGDLGLATILTQSGARLKQSIIGTPEFMAPEFYDEQYDVKVDVYAFGMSILEMVTHDYPYSECDNAAQIFKKVSTGQKPRGLYKIADPEVFSFIDDCLQNHQHRMTAAELLRHPFLQNIEDETNNREITLRTDEDAEAFMEMCRLRGAPPEFRPMWQKIAAGQAIGLAPAPVPPEAVTTPSGADTTNAGGAHSSGSAQPTISVTTAASNPSSPPRTGGESDGFDDEEEDEEDDYYDETAVPADADPTKAIAPVRPGIAGGAPSQAQPVYLMPNPQSSHSDSINRNAADSHISLQISRATESPAPPGAVGAAPAVAPTAGGALPHANLPPRDPLLVNLRFNLSLGDGNVTVIEFEYHIGKDTPQQVAQEMVREIGLPDQNVAAIAGYINTKIQEYIHQNTLDVGMTPAESWDAAVTSGLPITPRRPMRRSGDQAGLPNGATQPTGEPVQPVIKKKRRRDTIQRNGSEAIQRKPNRVAVLSSGMQKSASLSTVHPPETGEHVPPELAQRQERERLALQAQTRAMEQRHAQEWAEFQKRRADGSISDLQELRNLEELANLKTVVEANNDSFEKALAALEGMTLDEKPKRRRSASKGPPSPDTPNELGSGHHGHPSTPLAGVGGQPPAEGV